MTQEKLRDYTNQELAEIRERTRRLSTPTIRPCLWCEREKAMRPDQTFCSASCRVAYSRAAAQIQYERLLREREEWRARELEYLREIWELKKSLGTGN